MCPYTCERESDTVSKRSQRGPGGVELCKDNDDGDIVIQRRQGMRCRRHRRVEVTACKDNVSKIRSQ